MLNSKIRKHPRVYSKQNMTKEDNTLVLSGTTALGVLVTVFAKGLLIGYMLKHNSR